MSCQNRNSAFTLLELMVVMVLVGIVAGIGMAGFDRIEPGRSSLQAAVENFIESSRDRARASNQRVVLSLQPATESAAARWQRMVFRGVFEASFEGSALARENVQLEGQSALNEAGRFGAGLNLIDGGTGIINGRGTPDLSSGFVIDFDCYPSDLASGKLLTWPGIVTIEQRNGGALSCQIRAGDGDFFGNSLVETTVGALQPRRWQHLRLYVASGQALLTIDGKVAASTALPEFLSTPQDVPVFGDIDRPWHGKIDEFQVQSRQVERGPEVPDDVQMILSQPEITFNRFGELDASHNEDVTVLVDSFGELLATFVVGRFSQEVIQ
ncbi:MAG: prepilin-type N-terminal cleavage/methylation domain-containing protein [Planctomycetota bacterium]|nr:prepilin-type N-terminal cleavage/methylation domain-containing protein [Planctomycetota bacterium]